jgi:hypothetical protein
MFRWGAIRKSITRRRVLAVLSGLALAVGGGASGAVKIRTVPGVANKDEQQQHQRNGKKPRTPGGKRIGSDAKEDETYEIPEVVRLETEYARLQEELEQITSDEDRRLELEKAMEQIRHALAEYGIVGRPPHRPPLSIRTRRHVVTFDPRLPGIFKQPLPFMWHGRGRAPYVPDR